MSSDSGDPRLDHIRISAQQALKFEIGLWKELIWKEENEAIIKDFLDTPATTILLVYSDKNDKLALSLKVSTLSSIPKSLCFFLKNNVVINSTNYKQEICLGNLTNFPLNQNENLFGKVIAPIFCNPLNNNKWPSEIGEDIADHVQDFWTILTYHVGLAEEQTVLMIPETARSIEKFDLEEMPESFNWELRNVLNSITEMISNWIPIVREVLELTPEHILLQIDQGPDTEITFWNKRRINLEYIYKQVNAPLVRKMAFALEKTNNCHFPNFRQLLQDIAEGFAESKEICSNFIELFFMLEKLDSSSVPELMDILPEALKLITSSWIQSKYYRSVPSRIIVLLQKICCFLIKKVHEFLDPLNLFQGDRKETRPKVKLTLDLAKLFLNTYYDCRKQFHLPEKESHLYPWEFPDERVFTQFEKFIQRLDDIHEIFLAAKVYFNIPSEKLTGIQQVPYKRRLEELHNRFLQSFATFEVITYNPLELHSLAFDEDYGVFSKNLLELDPKLAIIIGQLCLTSTPAEEAFEILTIFEDLVKRPSIQNELEIMLSSHTANLYMEALNAKENYRNFILLLNESYDSFVYKNLPTVSGALQWSLDLQKKLSSPSEYLQTFEEYFSNSDDYERALKLYQEIKEQSDQFEDYLLFKWKKMLDGLEDKMNRSLFVSEDASYVSLNFDYQLSEAAQEIRYLKLIQKEDLLPAEAQKFGEFSERFLNSQSLLSCSIRWYNDLKKNLLPYEEGLISKEWDEISQLLTRGFFETWTAAEKSGAV